MAIDIDSDALKLLLFLIAFCGFLLPPLAATITGIVCGFAMPGLPAGWGALVGLGLGIAGIAINIAGVLFLFAFVDVDPKEWAKAIFCQKPFYSLYGRNLICFTAIKWAPDPGVFWIGISLVTPATAAVGTWWRCRRRSTGLEVAKSLT